MLRNWIFLLIITLIFGFSCTNGNDKAAITNPGRLSPELNVQALNGQCLDLETIAAQMDDARFEFPGFVYTRNFEILGSSGGTEFTRTLIARSYRANPVPVRGFADLRGIKQSGCDSITMSDAGGINLNYKITNYTLRDLDLELDTDALKESLKGFSSTHAEAIEEFPAVIRLTVRILNPTQVELISTYRTIPIECPKVSSIQIKEHLIYHWSENNPTPARETRLDPAYFRRLQEITDLRMDPETRSPEDLIVVSANQSQELLRTLQARQYARCR